MAVTREKKENNAKCSGKKKINREEQVSDVRFPWNSTELDVIRGYAAIHGFALSEFFMALAMREVIRSNAFNKGVKSKLKSYSKLTSKVFADE